MSTFSCEVIAVDQTEGRSVFTIAIFKDKEQTTTESFQIPSDGMEGVKRICRARIKELQDGEFTPIELGPVDVSPPPPPPPPPPPTQDELDLAAFLELVAKMQKLRAVLKEGEPDLIAIEDQVAVALKQHPEYVDAIK